jgi:hypothetical protein
MVIWAAFARIAQPEAALTVEAGTADSGDVDPRALPAAA